MQRRSIGVGYVSMGEEEKQLINRVLATNRLSYGPMCEQFEREWASLHGCRYGIACNSGTSALEVILHALKIQGRWNENDVVFIPALTFIANVSTVMRNGLRVHFVDIDPYTYTMNPQSLKKEIERVKEKRRRAVAVIPVHLAGLPSDMGPIMTIAKDEHLAVIEDSCEAVGATDHGKPVGSFGDATSFSMYSAHIITTGMGGMITTKKKIFATLCRSLINHGRDPVYIGIDDDEYSSPEIIDRRFLFRHLGYSYRLTELEAAIGLGQLKRIKRTLTARHRVASLLTQSLIQFASFLTLPTVPENRTHSWMIYPIVVKKGLDREKLTHHLEKHGIETRPLMPLLNQPAVIDAVGHQENRYPVAKRIAREGFYIGCHQGMTKTDVEYIKNVLKKFFA